MTPGQEVKSYSLLTYLQPQKAFLRFAGGFTAWTVDALEFKVCMNTVATNAGALRVSWCPLYEANRDLYLTSQHSNSVLYASGGTGVSGKIPVIAPDRQFSTSTRASYDKYCGLHIFVDSPLTNASGTVGSNQLLIYIKPIGLRFLDKYGYGALSPNVSLFSNTQLTPGWAPTVISQGLEQEEKSEKGLISGVAEDVKRVSDFAMKIPIFSPVASTVSAVASAVSSIAKWFGLGKPTSVAAITTVVTRQGSHLASCNGLDPAISLHTDPKATCAIAPEVFGEGLDVSNFELMARKYSLISTGSIASNATPNSLLKTIAANPAIILSNGATPPAQLETHCAFVLNQFSLWRGAVKLKFHFPVDAFTKGTIVLIATRFMNLPATFTTTGLNDYYVQVININGPTVAEITLPEPDSDQTFFNRSCTSGIAGLNYDWNVGLYVTTPFRTSSVAVQTWYSVEIALDSLSVALPCNKPVTTQGLFSGASSVLADHTLTQLKIRSFRELFRRYCRTSMTALGDPWEFNSEAKRLMSKFAYWRGTRRNSYNFLLTTTTTPAIVRANLRYSVDSNRMLSGPPAAVSQSQGGMEGCIEQNIAQSSEMVVECPFIYVNKFAPTPRLDPGIWAKLPHPELQVLGAGTIASFQSYVAYGDDMHFGVILPSLPYYVS